jgi:hypothetical protein
MPARLWNVSILLSAISVASIVPMCAAQTAASTPQKTTLTTGVEYPVTDSSNGSAIETAASSTATGDTAVSAKAAANGQPAPVITPTSAALVKELEDMKRRIAELEAELNANGGSAAETAATLKNATLELQPKAAETGVGAQEAAPTEATSSLPAEVTTKSIPFAWADWTWLNGNSRTVDSPMSTKYFTPEFRADINYIFDGNHPHDDTMGGSTESFRASEVQLEQLSFGGDIRIDNVRGRFLTMAGMFATTTPRNDASPGRGQWDLANAYRYFSEAWGGYHWNVQHGINLDAGIFVSYIGLFSYYNFDNWTYQPSYVSSNTPWFFNGVRLQWFPTDKLKIEPWFVNGWQSYGRPNFHPGLGGQIMYRPKPWLAMVFNNYGFGEDAVGIPARQRLHTDDSVEIKYYDNKNKYLDKAAFSFTGDLGCEYGGGVSCTGDKHGTQKQAFLGYMLYNRLWFKKDLYGLTVGGGQLNNPGRYLVLLPPINGATAITGTPYYSENPGDKYHAWDGTLTFDYMPSQFITFRSELGYRHTDLPYWSGRRGVTPPGTNNGSPGQFACNGTVGSSGSTASGATDLPTATANCASFGGVWFPDLRRDQFAGTLAVMVRF